LKALAPRRGGSNGHGQIKGTAAQVGDFQDPIAKKNARSLRDEMFELIPNQPPPDLGTKRPALKKLKMFTLNIFSRCAPARASLAAVATKSLSGCG
jgi:hypothetical protein